MLFIFEEWMRESQRLRRPTQECLGDNVEYKQYNKDKLKN